MTRDDISFAKNLTDEANWRRTRKAWETILAAEHRGMFKVSLRDERVGIAGIVSYGT